MKVKSLDWKWFLGIIDNITKNDIDVNIYPNPAKDRLFKNIKDQNNGVENNIFIFNLAGKLIYNSIIKNNSSTDIRHLKEGVYILKIINEKEQLFVTKKILKL